MQFDRNKILCVTSQGIEYQTDEGQTCFIDFNECGGICVGHRDKDAKPPYIEFSTRPRTRFVFGNAVTVNSGDWYGDFAWLEQQIRKAGRMTIDLA